MTDKNIRIGELAQLTGTKVPTIRYYEQIGLMPEPLRTASNQRVYGEAQVQRLRFIRRCRTLGFSIEQICELVELSSETERPCEEVDILTRRHLDEVEAKIADLSALAQDLRALSQRCQGGGLISCCGVLDGLNKPV